MKVAQKALIVGLCSLGVAGMGTDAWGLYRWVDDAGKVHYSDKLPPAQAGKGRAKLNEEGMVVKKVQEAKSREELIAEKEKQKELERLRQEQQQLIEEQRTQDEVLLKTFQSEADINLARNNKLTTIDVAIQVVRANIKRMKSGLEKQQKAAADLELAGKPVTKETLDAIEQLRTSLKDSYTSIITREQEKEDLRKKFQLDLDRFRRLKNLRAEVRDDKKDKEGARYSLLETVVPCIDQTECSAMWSRAEQYVRAHATTRIQMLSPIIIMTATPVLDKDLSITVSRLKHLDYPQGAMLFMDVQCRESENGEAFCKSADVEKVRMGFRGEMAPSVTIDMQGMSGLTRADRQDSIQSPDILRRFIGRWKSDRLRTMEGVRANAALSDTQKQRIEQILGKMVVNIRADAFSNYMPDTGTQADFIPYQVVEAGENWIVISYLDPTSKKTETRKWFTDGDTIYSDLIELDFREYYRRLD